MKWRLQRRCKTLHAVIQRSCLKEQEANFKLEPKTLSTAAPAQAPPENRVRRCAHRVRRCTRTSATMQTCGQLCKLFCTHTSVNLQSWGCFMHSMQVHVINVVHLGPVMLHARSHTNEHQGSRLIGRRQRLTLSRFCSKAFWIGYFLQAKHRRKGRIDRQSESYDSASMCFE